MSPRRGPFHKSKVEKKWDLAWNQNTFVTQHFKNMYNCFFLATNNVNYTCFMEHMLDNWLLLEEKPPPSSICKRRMWFPNGFTPHQPLCHMILYPPSYVQAREGLCQLCARPYHKDPLSHRCIRASHSSFSNPFIMDLPHAIAFYKTLFRNHATTSSKQIYSNEWAFVLG